MRLLALALICASTPAFAAEQFDLECQGTRMSRRDGPTEPYRTRLHIDLAGRRWCADACDRVLAMDDVRPDRIVMKDDSTLNTREESTTEIFVDRQTNAFHRRYVQVRPETVYEKLEAACTEQPFTPLPNRP